MLGYSSVFASDIGVICSTDKEANLLSKELSSLSIENVHNRNVVKGQIKGKNIVVIVSRMGKAMNAATAQFLYDYYHTDQIVSVGFSASVDNAFKPGDVVFALEAGYHDYGAYKPYGFVRRADILHREDKKLDRLFSSWVSANKGKLIKIASGEQFIESTKKRDWIRKTANAQAVDMSSAAIYDVCVFNGISCGFIRQISDNADETGQENFKQSIKEGGAMKAVAALKKYFSEFTE